MDEPMQLVINLAVLIMGLAGWWKVFEKAGEPGWTSLIPIFNVYVLLRLVGRTGWSLLLLFVPGVNLIVWILVCHELSCSFGHGVGFTIGLLLLPPVFMLILGLDGTRFQGEPPVIVY